MVNFKFQCQFQDGQSLDIIPTGVTPFGGDDIIRPPDGLRKYYELSMDAVNPRINGNINEGSYKFEANILFEKIPSPYVLVIGGWLPMPLALPTNFLVDRNVVDHLKKITIDANRADKAEFKFWIDFFKEGSATFHALPFAWESNKRRMPSYDEFCASMQDGVQALDDVFPRCRVIRLGDHALRAAYEIMWSFQVRYEFESDFLMVVCADLVDKVARGQEQPILDKIIRIAKDKGVNPFSPVFLAVISCLYEDINGGFSIGRKLLKPKRNYSLEAAYNAISDMRHIELSAACCVDFGAGIFYLTTCDKALAAFWCAICPVGCDNSSDFSINFRINKSLTPRLSQDEFEGLFGLIKKYFDC